MACRGCLIRIQVAVGAEADPAEDSQALCWRGISFHPDSACHSSERMIPNGSGISRGVSLKSQMPTESIGGSDPLESKNCMVNSSYPKDGSSGDCTPCGARGQARDGWCDGWPGDRGGWGFAPSTKRANGSD